MDRNAGRGARTDSMPQSVIEFSSLCLRDRRRCSPRGKRARISLAERERETNGSSERGR